MFISLSGLFCECTGVAVFLLATCFELRRTKDNERRFSLARLWSSQALGFAKSGTEMNEYNCYLLATYVVQTIQTISFATVFNGIH